MANSIERMGVYHCGGIAEYNNWMFREQPINDVGIDAHMEFTEANGEVRQLLGLQIKTGQSWFKEKKKIILYFVILMNVNIIIGLRIHSRVLSFYITLIIIYVFGRS